MSAPGELTGRGVALIAGLAFGVIVAVNGVLTVAAVRSFSGLIVPNSYLASQDFNAARAAQIALGWTVTLTAEARMLRLAFTDARGRVVRPATLRVTLGRPTTSRDDLTIVLEQAGDGYAGAAALAPGAWRIELAATADDGTAFRQSRSLLVRAGT